MAFPVLVPLAGLASGAALPALGFSVLADDSVLAAASGAILTAALMEVLPVAREAGRSPWEWGLVAAAACVGMVVIGGSSLIPNAGDRFSLTKAAFVDLLAASFLAGTMANESPPASAALLLGTAVECFAVANAISRRSVDSGAWSEWAAIASLGMALLVGYGMGRQVRQGVGAAAIGCMVVLLWTSLIELPHEMHSDGGLDRWLAFAVGAGAMMAARWNFTVGRPVDPRAS